MGFRFELKDTMQCVPPTQDDHDDTPFVLVISAKEFSGLNFIGEDAHQEVADLEAAESNYVEIMPTYMVGSFAIPDRHNLTIVDPDLLSFYLDSKHLVFIDDSQIAVTLLQRITDEGLLRKMTVAHCLFLFFQGLLENDLIYLNNLEDSMEKLEEAIENHDDSVTTRDIAGYRRYTMRLSAYYQQISTMAEIISENEEQLMDRSDARAFVRVSNHADRLESRTDTIKEYSMQLRELYQTQIDLRQNSIMQLFTIVTVLFAPLTLVTGWFGMNLQYLPGLDWHYMSLFLLIMFIVLLVLLLCIFKHKKWI